ncbi:MAG: DNA-3-methyladenine glycosylase family protein [Chloroflexota bacterium]
MTTFEIRPRGPFDLAAATDFIGGFTAGIGADGTGRGIRMAFPVEGWDGSVAIDVAQEPDGTISADVAATGHVDLEVIQRQAARSLSLDHDGAGWVDVGRRDPVIGRLQERFAYLRPVCFYSAYEAATSFVIGQRIAMRQARVVKARLADGWGDEIDASGGVVRAFPRPQRLLEAAAVPGISAVKVDRLHALAQAALDGRLDTERLRALPEADALAELRTLPGVGEWTAQAVLLRGCGVADALPLGDEVSRRAVQSLYELPDLPDDETWTRIAEAWRPFRMWATVLLRVGWGRDQPAPPSYRQGSRTPEA